MLLRLIVICLLFFNCACQKKTLSETKSKKISQIILMPSDIAEVKTTQIYDSFKATGELKPITESIVSSQVEGIALQVKGEEGDYVRAGQLLVIVDNKDPRDQLTTNQEALQKAIARANLAKTTLNRKKQGYKEDLIAKQEVDIAETDYQVNLREIESAKAQVSLAQTAMHKANVKAPISGIISQKLIKTGELAQPGKSLFEIVQINPLKVELAIPSKYLNQIYLQQSVSSTVNGEVFIAKVIRINPIADQATRSIILTAQVPNPESKLKANLFVNSEIKLTSPRQAIIIPQEATYKVNEENNNKFFVYIYSEGQLNKRPITAEPLSAIQYEVKTGLEVGEKLVIVPLNITSETAKAQISKSL